MLFSLMGYQWVFSIMEEKATARLEKQIDAGEYDIKDLVEIRIPLSMPYYTDKGYEAVYGETDWNGKHYRYVKRKISGNVLHLFCLPHTEKNRIITAKNDLAGTFNNNRPDNQQENPGTSIIKLMQVKYLQPVDAAATPDGKVFPANNRLFNSALHSQYDPLSPFQPPEIV